MSQDLLLDGFMRHLRVERGLSPNTCLSYGYQLGAYVTFLRGMGGDPAAATRDDILAYLERRKDDGLKSASLFIAAMAIRQFHRHLAQTGRAPADPTIGMRLPRFKQRIPKPVDAEGMERLLRPFVGAKFSTVRDHAMLELYVFSSVMCCVSRCWSLLSLGLDKKNAVDGTVTLLAAVVV